MVRQGALQRLDDEERRSLHRRAAELIERTRPADVFDLAYHYDRSGAPARAVAAALEAASVAWSRQALESAETMLQIAARGATDADPATRLRVAEELGSLLMLRGSYDGSARWLGEARSLVPPGDHAAEIEGKIGELAFKRGDVRTAADSVERALGMIGRRVPRRGIVLLPLLGCELVVQMLHSLLPAVFVGRRSVEGERSRPPRCPVPRASRVRMVVRAREGRHPLDPSPVVESRGAVPADARAGTGVLGACPRDDAHPLAPQGRPVRAAVARDPRPARRPLGTGPVAPLLGRGPVRRLRVRGLAHADARGARAPRADGRPVGAEQLPSPDRDGEVPPRDLAGAAEDAKAAWDAGLDIGDPQARGIGLEAWAKSTDGQVPEEVIRAELERSSEDVLTIAGVMQAEGVRLLGIDEPSAAVGAFEESQRLFRRAGMKNAGVSPVRPWLLTALLRDAEATPRRDRRRGRSFGARAPSPGRRVGARASTGTTCRTSCGSARASPPCAAGAADPRRSSPGASRSRPVRGRSRRRSGPASPAGRSVRGFGWTDAAADGARRRG